MRRAYTNINGNNVSNISNSNSNNSNSDYSIESFRVLPEYIEKINKNIQNIDNLINIKENAKRQISAKQTKSSDAFDIKSIVKQSVEGLSEVLNMKAGKNMVHSSCNNIFGKGIEIIEEESQNLGNVLPTKKNISDNLGASNKKIIRSNPSKASTKSISGVGAKPVVSQSQQIKSTVSEKKIDKADKNIKHIKDKIKSKLTNTSEIIEETSFIKNKLNTNVTVNVNNFINLASNKRYEQSDNSIIESRTRSKSPNLGKHVHTQSKTNIKSKVTVVEPSSSKSAKRSNQYLTEGKNLKPKSNTALSSRVTKNFLQMSNASITNDDKVLPSPYNRKALVPIEVNSLIKMMILFNEYMLTHDMIKGDTNRMVCEDYIQLLITIAEVNDIKKQPGDEEKEKKVKLIQTTWRDWKIKKYLNIEKDLSKAVRTTTINSLYTRNESIKTAFDMLCNSTNLFSRVIQNNKDLQTTVDMLIQAEQSGDYSCLNRNFINNEVLPNKLARKVINTMSLFEDQEEVLKLERIQKSTR